MESWVDFTRKRINDQRKNIDIVKNGILPEGSSTPLLDSVFESIKAVHVKMGKQRKKKQIIQHNLITSLKMTAESIISSNNMINLNESIKSVVYITAICPSFAEAVLDELKKRIPTQRNQNQIDSSLKLDLKYVILNFYYPHTDLHPLLSCVSKNRPPSFSLPPFFTIA